MKNDLYKTVTDAIIEQIEGGVLPWTQPWTSSGLTAGLPVNLVSQNPYSGINILILWADMIEKEFLNGQFLTFKQAKKLGGSVIKGSRGTRICYASSFISKQERAEASREGREPSPSHFLKAYTVFNVDQCEGLPENIGSEVIEMPECEKVEIAEKLIKETGARIKIGGDRAYYNRIRDYVQFPPQPCFKDSINYYNTAFHELGHWTGHESRLNRKFGTKRGDSGYAFEELVAEMTSAFVCASLNIQPTVRHADYIGSWLVVLKNDKRAIFKAASMASKAANLILGNTSVAKNVTIAA